MSQKNVIKYIIYHNFAKIKIGSFDFLPLEKKFNLDKVIGDIEPVFNKDNSYEYIYIYIHIFMYIFVYKYVYIYIYLIYIYVYIYIYIYIYILKI